GLDEVGQLHALRRRLGLARARLRPHPNAKETLASRSASPSTSRSSSTERRTTPPIGGSKSRPLTLPPPPVPASHPVGTRTSHSRASPTHTERSSSRRGAARRAKLATHPAGNNRARQGTDASSAGQRVSATT